MCIYTIHSPTFVANIVFNLYKNKNKIKKGFAFVSTFGREELEGHS